MLALKWQSSTKFFQNMLPVNYRSQHSVSPSHIWVVHVEQLEKFILLTILHFWFSLQHLEFLYNYRMLKTENCKDMYSYQQLLTFAMYDLLFCPSSSHHGLWTCFCWTLDPWMLMLATVDSCFRLLPIFQLILYITFAEILPSALLHLLPNLEMMVGIASLKFSK